MKVSVICLVSGSAEGSGSARSSAGRTAGGSRGQSELVGLVLLFGMVIAGAALVFVAGGSVLDMVESDAEMERAELEFDQTSSQIRSAYDGATARSVPETSATRTVEENTTELEFRRVNVTNSPAGPGDLHWDAGDAGHAYNISLNALVYDLENERLVYEGGGEWRVSGNDNVTMRTPPSAAFSHDADGVSVNLVDVRADSGMGGGSMVAEPETRNAVDRSDLRTELDYYEDDPAYGNDLMLVVESEYIDGWEWFFESSSSVDISASDVHYFDTAATGDDEVVIVFEDVLQEQWSALEVVDWEADEHVNRTAGDSFDPQVTVENPDDATIPTDGADVELVVDGTTVETESVDLDPGESRTVDFSSLDLDSILADDTDPDDYRPIDWAIETPDTNVTGTTLPVIHHNQPFYRIDDASSTTNATALEERVRVNLTNVGGTDDTRDVEITLESDEIGEMSWTQSVSTDRWNQSTVAFAFNRSALPEGNYTYTVEIQNAPPVEAQTASGSFSVGDDEGAVGDVGEIIITEPAEVEVGVIGTEISAEWNYGDTWYKRWGAVTASVVIGDTRYRLLPGGGTEEIPLDKPHDTDPGERIEDFNLNTFGTQEDVYDIEREVDNGSVSIEATYWQCDDYEYAGSDTWKGSSYEHYECAEFGEPTTVDVSGGDDASLDSGFVMTRDEERSGLPDIEEGYPRQRSIQEVFDDGTEDVDLDEGNLTLGENDFAFMMEVTSDKGELQTEYVEDNDVYPNTPYDLYSDDQTELNRAAWEIGMNYREAHPDDDYGDPNFNDVIGFAKVDPGETSLDPPNALESFRVDGTTVTPEQTDNGEIDAPTDDGGVEVGVGEIVIN